MNQNNYIFITKDLSDLQEKGLKKLNPLLQLTYCENNSKIASKLKDFINNYQTESNLRAKKHATSHLIKLNMLNQRASLENEKTIEEWKESNKFS